LGRRQRYVLYIGINIASQQDNFATQYTSEFGGPWPTPNCKGANRIGAAAQSV
jgi:hypothetical protein